MKQPSDLGANRTGLQSSPIHGKEVVDFSASALPSLSGSEQGLATMRIAYAQEAEPLGTMPPPLTVKGVVKTAVEAIKGHKPTVLIDKMAERMAFERTGTRLYEALLSKHDAYGSWDGGPSRAELERFHREELAHFDMLRRSIEQIGADATAVTPSAEVVAVASMGLIQVISDPRTNLLESLHAIHIAELTDNDGWQSLIRLARASGQDRLAEDFERAFVEEQQHLLHVRSWVSAGIAHEARVPMESLPLQP